MASRNEETRDSDILAVAECEDSTLTDDASMKVSDLVQSTPPSGRQPNANTASHENRKQKQIETMMEFLGVRTINEGFKTLELSPAKRPIVKKLSLQDILGQIFDDGFNDAFMVDTPENKNKAILLFLYNKGYFKEDAERRKHDISMFLSTRTIGQERMLRVINTLHDKWRLHRPRTRPGGSSCAILKHNLKVKKLLSWDSEDIRTDLIDNFTITYPEIWSCLQACGPALVSHFAVDTNFYESRLPQNRSDRCLPHFSGSYNKDKHEGYHSMVLVAIKRGETEWTLILQNWWVEMQFLEVTAEYFVSAGAELIWVVKSQTEMPIKYPLTKAILADTQIDGCDCGSGRAIDCDL
ncbi:hypothetical protein MPSEU_001033600 [Mayamaea pseudoterrestris]|nr:hypothetical protein MPSEU_001033600 [Mayamaea pseudoterrestris]